MSGMYTWLLLLGHRPYQDIFLLARDLRTGSERTTKEMTKDKDLEGARRYLSSDSDLQLFVPMVGLGLGPSTYSQHLPLYVESVSQSHSPSH